VPNGWRNAYPKSHTRDTSEVNRRQKAYIYRSRGGHNYVFYSCRCCLQRDRVGRVSGRFCGSGTKVYGLTRSLALDAGRRGRQVTIEQTDLVVDLIATDTELGFAGARLGRAIECNGGDDPMTALIANTRTGPRDRTRHQVIRRPLIENGTVRTSIGPMDWGHD
jgi:hypothetical protein